MKQFATFALVGVANTVIGLGTILLTQEAFGLNPVAANALGYAAGLTNSYLMNRAFTFKASPHSVRIVARFVLAFAAAYAVNLAILLAGLRVSADAAAVWQGIAMLAYTTTFFLLSKFYVFRSRA